jgi:hypothetical protein
MTNRLFVLFSVVFIIISSVGCSRKMQPSGTPTITPIHGISAGKEVYNIEKTPVKRMPKATFPKVITVNDSAASKNVEGKLYYDVMGHRYWKNYKDGKYYLFNKSMYKNPDFKKP